ncbi:MAG: energy coupling factor transporter S component ThiW [Clostridia bacterium]|nr:energy coupling factor transporter S component ThiW [Clostridia bacterium]
MKSGGFSTRKLTIMALFVAIGTITAHVIWFPAGPARAYPMQHAINVLTAVYLGPGAAGLIALVISALRNMLGLGTIFAFPGSIFGALLAGYLYRLFRKDTAAVVGEVFGTAVIGGLVSFPIAKFILGQEAAAFAFVIPFAVSSIAGAAVAFVLLRFIPRGRI